MPTTVRHAPHYHTDATGTRWRVYDQVLTPAEAWRFTAPGHPMATRRVFVREHDRSTFSTGFRGEDPGDATEAALDRQIDRALGTTPWKHAHESSDDYLYRQTAHMRAYPERFPRDMPRPGAWE